ncbi:MAG: hypothetical protein IJW97_08820 [Clostridia bacterium]|nr:hypothetical protein [Clostridia bacterium]
MTVAYLSFDFWQYIIIVNLFLLFVNGSASFFCAFRVFWQEKQKNNAASREILSKK